MQFPGVQVSDMEIWECFCQWSHWNKTIFLLRALKILSFKIPLLFLWCWQCWRSWPVVLGVMLVQFSCSVMSNYLQPHGLWHNRLSCPSPTPGTCSNSCPLSQWCHPTISSFSPCLQSFPASGSFPTDHFFTSGGQSIGASESVLPMNIQDRFPLGWTGWISFQSKGLSSVFSNTTIQKHQFFGAQPSLWSNSHIHMWLLEKP